MGLGYPSQDLGQAMAVSRWLARGPRSASLGARPMAVIVTTSQ
ncbi:hypothetical protein HMPREF0321_2543 [Dermacoccus sp. Ellin185]|nr:hypothetical protein HMPREF0321_2543 [Dermacoccus sp. Ellin185]